MVAGISIKQGEALVLMLQLQDDTGVPQPLSGLVFSGQVRDPQGVLIANLPIVSTGVTGTMISEIDTTAAWPIGTHMADFLIMSGTRPILTDTFAVTVNRGVTTTIPSLDLPPLSGLPTSPIGLAVGQLYWNAGVLCRVEPS